MKKLVNALVTIERDVSRVKGPFDLFALFLRENAPGTWDLLVSAAWVQREKSESLRFLSKKLQKLLDRNELLKISRIVIIDADNPALEVLTRSFQVEHGMVEIQNGDFFGLQIKHAYLITSRKGEHSAALQNQEEAPVS